MHFQILPLVALATSALAAQSDATILLPRHLAAFLPLEIRQGNVSPGQYACHEACGEAILKATGDYCQSTAWKGYYDGCMGCANDYGIWKWYGDKVTAAAKQCGLDAVPDPADATSAASSAVTAASSTVAPVASSAVGVSASLSSAASSVAGSSTSVAVVVPTTTSTLSAAPVPSSVLPTVSASSTSIVSLPPDAPRATVYVMLTCFIQPTAGATAVDNMLMVAIGVAGMVALPAIL